MGGRVSSGTIEASSTDGKGRSSVGEVAPDPPAPITDGGDIAVVGNRLDEDTLLSNDGLVEPSSLVDDMTLEPLIVALVTLLSRLLPAAIAWSPYPLLGVFTS